MYLETGVEEKAPTQPKLLHPIIFNCQAVDENDPNQASVLLWLKELSQYVPRIFVLALRVGNYKLPDNINVFHLSRKCRYNPINRAIRSWNYIRIIDKIISKEKKAIVFTFMGGMYPFFWIPYRLINRVVLVHWKAHAYIGPSMRLLSHWEDRIYTSAHESFPSSSKSRLIVGHGINTDLFSPLRDRRSHSSKIFRIVTTGRISKIKKNLEMAKIVKILIDRGHHLELYTYGPSDSVMGDRRSLKYVSKAGVEAADTFLAELQGFIDQNSLQNHFRLVGAIRYDEINKKLNEADLYLNLSQTGSLDRAVLEAMAAGCVVLTGNPGFYPILKDVAEGNCYVKLNQPEKIAEKIVFWMTASDYYKRQIGEELREIVKRDFRLETFIRKIVHDLDNISKKTIGPGRR